MELKCHSIFNLRAISAADASLRMLGERWESRPPTSKTASQARAGRASSLEQEVMVERSSTSSTSTSSSITCLSFCISLGTRVSRASAPAWFKTHVS